MTEQADASRPQETPTPRMWHKRLRGFEWIDRVELDIVPRWKTSGVSGDEWRQGVRVRGWFKGVQVLEYTCSDMATAAAVLPARMLEAGDSGLPDGVLAREKECCDQPSCENEPVERVRILRNASRSGQWLDPDDSTPGRYYRQFCALHSRRGDCGREDADRNYERIS